MSEKSESLADEAAQSVRVAHNQPQAGSQAEPS